MKKLLKYLLVLILIVVGAAAVFAGFIYVRGIPSYDDVPVQTDYHVQVTPQRIERGKKLAEVLCVHCHMDPKSGSLTGTLMKEAPPEFGAINSQNITQDKEFGIGNYTDGELLRLLRTGIKKDNQYSPPWMAKVPHMSDEDVASIIAFLRSDDPMVVAKAVPDLPCEPSFLSKFLCFVAFKPLPMPAGSVPQPDTTDKIALGRYLVYNLECYGCHSADFKTMNPLEPEKTVGYMGGGNKPLDAEGRIMITANLTPDKETGIGNWSEEKFVKALRYGLKDGEPALRYPMVPFIQLTEHEAQSIYAYLFTIPPIKNNIKRSAFDS